VSEAEAGLTLPLGSTTSLCLLSVILLLMVRNLELLREGGGGINTTVTSNADGDSYEH
jgi:hypothetical protein